MTGNTSRLRRGRRLTLTSALQRCVLPLAVLAAILAVTAFAGVSTARAEEKPTETVSDSSKSLLDEIAGALGFTDSNSPGFWEAFQDARSEELEAVESERVKANDSIIRDALAYGRRVEEASGPRFVEYLPGPDGDVYVRIGYEEVNPNTGALIRVVRYFLHGDFSAAATVTSVVEDGVEKVIKVDERVPGTTDLKVGDSRPVPPPTTSLAGKKPSSLDPRSDGSLGRASGAHPDAPGGPQPGVRHEFEAISLPDGREITPWLEERPSASDPTAGLTLVTGIDIAQPSWGDVNAHVEVLTDKKGKAAAIVAWVNEKGTDTIVAVRELVPGAAGGLKEGDTRPTPSDGGPKSWTPKSSGSSASGDAHKDSGTGAAAAGDTQPDAGQSDTGSADASSHKGTAEEHPDWQFHGSSAYIWPDGTSMSVSNYDTPDGGDAWVTTVKDADGNTTSSSEHCYKDSKEVSCDSGFTEEPTCTTGCERLEFLAALFCSGCETGLPFANTTDVSKGPAPALSAESSTYPISIVGWAWSHPDKVGAPKDSGDPNDPNTSESIPYLDPRFDGNLDPVEPELAAADAADTFAHDMRGTLRDPAGPRDGSEPPVPEGTPPKPGDAE